MKNAEKIRAVRPRFLIETKLTIAEIEELLKAELKKQNYPCYGSVAYGYSVIKISKKMQHFWSPQLSLSMEQEVEKTTIRGLYGPKPSVWTMIMFLYAILGFSTLIVTMVGLTKLSLEKPAEILWFAPIGLLLILLTYIASTNGKKLGKDHLQILHHFFEKATNLKAIDQIN